MLPRIIIGAVAGYLINLLALGVSLSAGSSASASGFLLQRSMAFLDTSGFDPLLTLPTLLGAVAGFCWHLISTERKQ